MANSFSVFKELILTNCVFSILLGYGGLLSIIGYRSLVIGFCILQFFVIFSSFVKPNKKKTKKKQKKKKQKQKQKKKLTTGWAELVQSVVRIGIIEAR